MILLWGSRSDGPLTSVSAALDALACPATFVDDREPLHTQLDITADGEVHGRLAAGGEVLDLDAVEAAYVRPHDRSRERGARRADRDWILSWNALWTWCDMARVPVINRPLAMSGCFSKAHQLPMIVSAGFAVPETVITTDPQAATEFWSRHETVIYKSISGTRSIVSRLTPSHRQRLEDVRWCPAQFQEFVPGIDHRVHVVGESIYSSTIHSTHDDYRYAAERGDAVQVSQARVPEECAKRCQELSRNLSLLVAGIDLRLAPDGRWYCFEVNPSPAFTYYDREAGRPIASGIAALLTDLGSLRTA